MNGIYAVIKTTYFISVLVYCCLGIRQYVCICEHESGNLAFALIFAPIFTRPTMICHDSGINHIFYHKFGLLWPACNKILSKEICSCVKNSVSVEFVHLAALPRRRRMRRVARCAAATEYRPAGHANNRTARMCAKKSRPKIASLCL